MPLFDLETMQQVTEIPYKRDYNLYMSRHTQDEIAAIKEWVNAKIDSDKIHTAGWMPGSNWMGTVLEPIYTKATKRNFDLAGKCFGLMVYVVFMERPEEWVSGRFELRGRDIGSRTYFRKRS